MLAERHKDDEVRHGGFWAFQISNSTSQNPQKNTLEYLKANHSNETWHLTARKVQLTESKGGDGPDTSCP